MGRSGGVWVLHGVGGLGLTASADNLLGKGLRMQLLAKTQALDPGMAGSRRVPSTGWAAEVWQLQPVSSAFAPGSAGLAM